jgi:serine/threonine-protein kinase ATR
MPEMARRGGGQLSTQHGAPNTDNLPPPSTIAAQIVHNRSNVARQGPESEALFGKLLLEYLRDPVIEEANVETNAQLISVVAEAGLDVLGKDNPFAPDHLLQQANDSLSVIEYTIRRTPEVLLFTGIGSPSDELPLFLWLLPKILNLLGHRQMDRTQAKLADVLTACTQSLVRSSRFWRYAIIVQDIFRGLVEGECK